VKSSTKPINLPTPDNWDNVEQRWENVITGAIQAPFIQSLTDYLNEQNKTIRILELGSGSGGGLQSLTQIPHPNAPVSGAGEQLIPPEFVQTYHGLESDKKQVTQAQKNFHEYQNISFMAWNPADGINIVDDEPYDLYVFGKNALSYIDPENTKQILTDIVHHAGERAMVIMEWIGQFGYSHQPDWMRQIAGPATLNTPNGIIPLGGRDSAESLVEDTSKSENIFIRLTSVTDRSVFVGRSMNTSERYESQSLRPLVNSLWEPAIRTPLEKLLVDYNPSEGFGQVNAFYMDFAAAWNAVIGGAQYMLQEIPDTPSINEIPLTMQGIVERAWTHLRSAARLGDDMEVGDSRAYFLEPYLANMLRDLELQLQQGIGCGASLIALAEIRKTRKI
jgi:hypothetical protein